MEIEENFTKFINHKIIQIILIYTLTFAVLTILTYVFFSLILTTKGFINVNMNSMLIFGFFTICYAYVATKISLNTIQASKEALMKINKKA